MRYRLFYFIALSSVLTASVQNDLIWHIEELTVDDFLKQSSSQQWIEDDEPATKNDAGWIGHFIDSTITPSDELQFDTTDTKALIGSFIGQKPIYSDFKADEASLIEEDGGDFLDQFKQLPIAVLEIDSSLVGEEQISDDKAMVKLGEALVDRRRYRQALALPFISKVDLQSSFLLMRAKAYLRSGHFWAADQLANQLLIKNEQALMRELAYLESELGHASLAKELFEKSLDMPLIDYASVMLSWGDYCESEKIIRSALENNPHSTDLRQRLAKTLTAAQRYDEAEQLYQILLWEKHQPSFLYEICQLKLLKKEFQQFFEYLEMLQPVHGNVYYEAQKLKGAVFTRLKEYKKALEFYLRFPWRQEDQSAIYLEIGKLYSLLGCYSQAEGYLMSPVIDYPEKIRALFYAMSPETRNSAFVCQLIQCEKNPQTLFTWGNCFIETAQADQALILFEAACNADQYYYPALWQKAELLAAENRYQESETSYLMLLQLFPNNPRIQLELARVASWDKRYAVALRRYDDFIALNEGNPLPLLEKARVAFWSKNAELGLQSYNQLLSLADTKKAPFDISWFGHSAPLTFSADRICSTVPLESYAKEQVWNKAPISALTTWELLIRQAPGNEEALFDYAQLLQATGEHDAAEAVYRNLLIMTPLHNIVKRSLKKSEQLCNPSFALRSLYWHENGYGLLSNVRRYAWQQQLVLPVNSRYSLAVSCTGEIDRGYDPKRDFSSYKPSISIKGRFSPFLAISADYARKIYRDKSHDRTLGGFLLCVQADDLLGCDLGFDRREEQPNSFAISQKITENIPWIALRSFLTRSVFAELLYRHQNYSDTNTQYYGRFLTSYQLTEHPRVVKLIGQFEYRHTLYDNIYYYKGSEVIAITHPYWAPQHYVSGKVTLELRYDYAEFEFYESEKRYIDLKLSIGSDSNNNPSQAALLEWHVERDDHWTLSFEITIERSPEWISEGFSANCSYLF